jgi:hypothetical protein
MCGCRLDDYERLKINLGFDTSVTPGFLASLWDEMFLRRPTCGSGLASSLETKAISLYP